MKVKRTIFNTPILSALLHYCARGLLYLAGWRIEGQLPDIQKYVFIGAPHTSNWDFVLFLGLTFYTRSIMHFMGKEELFRGPFAWFFYWCGGIPVRRSQSAGLVEQMVTAFKESDDFILAIAPEGTRYQINEWKTGFYHIAKNAGVPIVMALVNGKEKIVGLGKMLNPTENTDEDFKAIKFSFDGIIGINPSKKQTVWKDN